MASGFGLGERFVGVVCGCGLGGGKWVWFVGVIKGKGLWVWFRAWQVGVV